MADEELVGPRPMTLDDWAKRAMPGEAIVRAEVERMMRPNPLLELLQQNMPPPEPAPWWRRWWWGVTRRLGTSLIRAGRAMGGDEDD